MNYMSKTSRMEAKPLESPTFGAKDRPPVFMACPECIAAGDVGALYISGGIVRCGVHGEVSDPERLAEYRQHDSPFLVGMPPTQD